MTAEQGLVSIADLFDSRILRPALQSLGNYVYGYYEPNKIEPFYVGKGQGDRVLAHWRNALKDEPKLAQCKKIREILKSGNTPTVKILAHHLESTKGSEV